MHIFFVSLVELRFIYVLAKKVIDAFGKPTSGILLGSLSWLGEYSQCKNATNGDAWKGKYCILSKPNNGEVLGAPLVNLINFENTFSINLSLDLANYLGIKIRSLFASPVL